MGYKLDVSLRARRNRNRQNAFQWKAQRRKRRLEFGIVEVAHPDKTYDVRVAGRAYPYTHLHPSSRETIFHVGDHVTIAFGWDNPQLPFILCKGNWLTQGLADADGEVSTATDAWERFQKDFRGSHQAANPMQRLDVEEGELRHLAWEVAQLGTLVTSASKVHTARSGTAGDIMTSPLLAIGYESAATPDPWPPDPDPWTELGEPIGTAETFVLTYPDEGEAIGNLLVVMSHYSAFACYTAPPGGGGGGEEDP